jgi:histidyl-tRNA synthetase
MEAAGLTAACDLAGGLRSPTLWGMAISFQAPPGTRDFYPESMALRRYLEDTWRRVSLRHGFVEVDGPTFEFLDLYKVKSGDEIVAQLFHFESRGEDKKEFALRPEFTPTLARMVAAKANALPRPIKWFSIPRCYRAERPQKGRLREFMQWNVDMLGGETPEARRQFDLETAALCLDCLREFGLTATAISLLWNDRSLVEELFALAQIPPSRHPFAFYLLDRIAKLSADQRRALLKEQNATAGELVFFDKLAAGNDPLTSVFWQEMGTFGYGLGDEHFENYRSKIEDTRRHVDQTLALLGLPGFAKYDASIVRGLAYYTGFVWEISDAGRENRAIAGGGRYDRLIEMFGGPALPATGFGMGDVVLANLLEETGKLPANLTRPAAPDVFIVNALPTSDEALKLIGELRAAKCAVATSYKTTKNIGKLLQEASASGARFAVILAPAEWQRGVVKLKNLATREEKELPLSEIIAAVRSAPA